MTPMSLGARINDFLFAKRLEKARRTSADASMLDFYQAEPPSSLDTIHNTEFLVLDLEMSGLDPKSDQILSIGYAVIKQKQIKHTKARHVYINNLSADLSETAPLHGIMHDDLSLGLSLEQALEKLLQDLRGKVLVLHHARLDKSFLTQACKQHYGCALVCRTVDTMLLERARLVQQGKEPHQLSLAKTRQRYGLPNYHAHNAAIDALATAELFLAQLSFIAPNTDSRLGLLW